MCCRYCYNAAERNAIDEQTIPMEIAKAGIDWYFETNDSRHIRFYGPGEPTQEFNKMKQITEYAKNHSNGGNRVTVEIQTNGVFTDEIRRWALDNINIMWMSFDGMLDVQNYNRPLNPRYKDIYDGKTSGEVLEENVKWLINNKGDRNLMVGARVTITDKNIDKQIELVDYFYIKDISYVSDFEGKYTLENSVTAEIWIVSNCVDEPEEVVEQMAKNIAHGVKYFYIIPKQNSCIRDLQDTAAALCKKMISIGVKDTSSYSLKYIQDDLFDFLPTSIVDIVYYRNTAATDYKTKLKGFYAFQEEKDSISDIFYKPLELSIHQRAGTIIDKMADWKNDKEWKTIKIEIT